MIKAIKNAKLVLPNEIIENKTLLYNKHIVDIIENTIPLGDMEVYDAKGNYLSSGFIDTHIHGLAGVDVMDGTVESIQTIAREVCKSGVTSFIPTTMTMEPLKIFRALDSIKKVMLGENEGATILGAHLEGPFINEVNKGAQNEKYILTPNYELINKYADVIKMITIAPEMDKDYIFMDSITKKHNHILLSIGHSNATYNMTKEAINKGIKSATHLFNGMSGLHHREPGVVGAVLDSDIYCEIIADNIHLHPSIYRMVTAMKGLDKIILITDSIRATSLRAGKYDLGGQMINVSETMATLENGTLAGSILKLNKAVKNMRDNTCYNLTNIINMVSINPATLLGIEDKKGSIKIGKDADLTVFNEDLDIMATIVDGKCTYRQKK